MTTQDPRLRKIWFQSEIPAVYRPEKSQALLIRLPYAADNRVWLKADHRNNPKWNGQHKRWETAKSWFEGIVRRALKRFGRVYVIQPFRAQQTCAPACWDAAGFTCGCSCMGQNHGSGNPAGRWYIISEALAVHWGPRQYSFKLLETSDAQQAFPNSSSSTTT